MPANWREVARRGGFALSPEDSTTVELKGGTKHVVSFTEADDSPALRAIAIVARPSVVAIAAGDEGPLRYAWERNRLCDLVGFTIDKQGRLIAETWIPLDGLTPSEFSLHVGELARIADWHEFRLAGEDIY